MISVIAAAKRANVHPSRIRRLMIQKRIAGEKINPRMWLVDEASLQAWIDSPRKGGRPPAAAKIESIESPT